MGSYKLVYNISNQLGKPDPCGRVTVNFAGEPIRRTTLVPFTGSLSAEKQIHVDEPIIGLSINGTLPASLPLYGSVRLQARVEQGSAVEFIWYAVGERTIKKREPSYGIEPHGGHCDLTTASDLLQLTGGGCGRHRPTWSRYPLEEVCSVSSSSLFPNPIYSSSRWVIRSRSSLHPWTVDHADSRHADISCRCTRRTA